MKFLTLSFTVKGLVEGKPYEFRVAAVNEAGPGKYAETDDAIKPEAPPCMLFFFSLIFHTPNYFVFLTGSLQEIGKD